MGYNGDLYPTAGADVVMTTSGDLVKYTTERARLGIGSTNQILQVKSALPSWQTVPLADTVLTTAGDVLYENNTPELARLPKGSDADVLTLASGLPAWSAPAGGGAFTVLYDSGKLGVAGSLDSGASTFASHDYLQISIFGALEVADAQCIKFNDDSSANYCFRELRDGVTKTTSNYPCIQYTFGTSDNWANATWFINQRAGAEKIISGYISEQKGTGATDQPSQDLTSAMWIDTSSNINRVTGCRSDGLTVDFKAGSQMIIWGA